MVSIFHSLKGFLDSSVAGCWSVSVFTWQFKEGLLLVEYKHFKKAIPILKKYPFVNFTATFFLALWLITSSLCGMGPFSQSSHMLPHDSSQSASPDCAQVCLSKNVSYQDLALRSLEFKLFQVGLRPGVRLALIPEVSSFSGFLEELSPPRSSTKLYKFLSTYRIWSHFPFISLEQAEKACLLYLTVENSMKTNVKMFLKMRIFFFTTVFLLTGLLAFNLCLIHPAAGDSHSPTHNEEQACNDREMVSFFLPSSLVGGPAQIPPQPKIPNFDLFTSDFGNTFLKQVLQLPLRLSFSPIQTIKRHKFICVYLI